MPHVTNRESDNVGSAPDAEKREIVAPAPPALPEKIGVTHLSRPRQVHPFSEQAWQPSPPRCCREAEYRTLARVCLPRRREQVRSLFRPQTHQESRLFREFTSRPIIPHHVIGSLCFFRQWHLRADNGLGFHISHSRSLHQSFLLDLFCAGHHHHAIAKRFTARFIKKWY